MRLLLAFTSVLLCELLLRVLGFHVLHSFVRRFPTIGRCSPEMAGAYATSLSETIERVSPLAAVRAYCLSRSAATVCLLRMYGVRANVVIGVLRFPFAAHAWVEVEGKAMQDLFEITEGYVVLDRI